MQEGKKIDFGRSGLLSQKPKNTGKNGFSETLSENERDVKMNKREQLSRCVSL